MIKLNYIQEFVVLAETLNFSKTAEMTFITQPALSRHIAELEQEMGGPLLVRTTRSVSLTPAGEAAYDQFNHLLQHYHAAREQVAFLSSGRAGTLKLCSPYYWSVDYTEPLAEEFLESHPNCDLKLSALHPPDGLQALAQGRVDAMISDSLIALDGEEHICRVPFSHARLAVTMRRDHPLADRQEVALEELSGSDFVMATDGAETGEGALNRNLNSSTLRLMAEHHVQPGRILYTQQIDTIGMTLHRSGGVGIVPYAIRRMDRADIRVIPLSNEDCRIPVCLYFRGDDRSALLASFVQHTKAWGKRREEPGTA